MPRPEKPFNGNGPRNFDEIDTVLRGPRERDLDHLVRKRGPLPVFEAVDCLLHAARGLDALHRAGIVHGNFTPRSLTIDDSGMVRVCDPVVVQAGSAVDSRRQPAHYIAPEQAADARYVDHRVDIFSLGCTLYFLLTSRDPFAGETIEERGAAGANRAAPSLRSVRPEVSMALDACYQKMTATRPDDRPRSMSEVITLLQASKLSSPETNGRIRIRQKLAFPIDRRWSRPVAAGLLALAAAGLLMAALAMIMEARRWLATTNREHPRVAIKSPPAEPVPLPSPEPTVVSTIFDGKTSRGWMLCNHGPVPARNIEPDGLNPHGTGSYLVVYAKKLGDFELEFDYKLSAGCNSGVFIRVSDLNDPVRTGTEVAIDDTRHGDDRDTGALHGLVGPESFTQNPTGQWNHMKITAQGPRLAVSLNGTEVSRIDVDQWTVAGKRPDGSAHRFKDRIAASMARSRYLGFQDLGRDCWFKNIKLTYQPPAKPR